MVKPWLYRVSAFRYSKRNLSENENCRRDRSFLSVWENKLNVGSKNVSVSDKKQILRLQRSFYFYIISIQNFFIADWDASSFLAIDAAARI